MDIAADPRPGALVISLDFELHWGLRDHIRPGDNYEKNLHGARDAVPRLLELFDQLEISATWATVGFLFAASEEERRAFWPEVRPAYRDPNLSPYNEPVGRGEVDDPLHFAWSLIEKIGETPRQEVASHTFSHYLCLEPGQDEVAFRADLAAAQRIAAWRGISLGSLVLPRNQWNRAYATAVRDSGFRCYRPPQQGRAPAGGATSSAALARAFRLADTYINIDGTAATPWDDLAPHDGLCGVPASRFLRPVPSGRQSLEPMRRRRISHGLANAARAGSVFHLWWHPHNFGGDLESNLRFLRSILGDFAKLRDTQGMESLTMSDVADRVGAPTRPTGS